MYIIIKSIYNFSLAFSLALNSTSPNESVSLYSTTTGSIKPFLEFLGSWMMPSTQYKTRNRQRKE